MQTTETERKKDILVISNSEETVEVVAVDLHTGSSKPYGGSIVCFKHPIWSAASVPNLTVTIYKTTADQNDITPVWSYAAHSFHAFLNRLNIMIALQILEAANEALFTRGK